MYKHMYGWRFVNTETTVPPPRNSNVVWSGSLECLFSSPKAFSLILLCTQIFCCQCSVTQSCPTSQPHGLQARQASLSLTISRSVPQLMFIASVMLSSHLILWRPLLLLPSVFPSIRDFSCESSVCIRWPKYWSFSISPASEYSELIPFKIDWFDLFAVRGTFRSLLQHHSSKASILWRSAFFTVQPSELYVTTGKTIALTIWTFVGSQI